MKRVFSLALLLMALGCVALLVACGDDDSSEPQGPGEVSGTVTFLGTWPSTGQVEIGVFSTLSPPDYRPTGPPDAYTNPIAPNTTTYDYTLAGLDTGTYAGIIVSWREPPDEAGAKMLGVYWFEVDSLGVDATGDNVLPPGPKPVVVTKDDPTHSGLDIIADLEIAPHP